MRLTIIPIDLSVYKNGIARMPLDLTTCDIPSNVHALQWYETWGEIEFVTDSLGNKPTNEKIVTLPDWANACVVVWDNWQPPAPPSPSPLENQPTTNGTQDL